MNSLEMKLAANIHGKCTPLRCSEVFEFGEISLLTKAELYNKMEKASDKCQQRSSVIANDRRKWPRLSENRVA